MRQERKERGRFRGVQSQIRAGAALAARAASRRGRPDHPLGSCAHLATPSPRQLDSSGRALSNVLRGFEHWRGCGQMSQEPEMGDGRQSQILDLMQSCSFSIHDLSRAGICANNQKSVAQASTPAAIAPEKTLSTTGGAGFCAKFSVMFCRRGGQPVCEPHATRGRSTRPNSPNRGTTVAPR